MWDLITALLIVDASTPPSGPEVGQAVTYHSPRSLPALQKCLTDKLTAIGEVVAVKLDDGTTTLVLRNISGGPMTIDLAPPSITVTSNPAPQTRPLIKACL